MQRKGVSGICFPALSAKQYLALIFAESAGFLLVFKGEIP
jgi:hypothetical protein